MKAHGLFAIVLLAALLSSMALIAQERDSANPGLVPAGIKISEPSDGSVFQSGDSVVVVMESVAPFQAQSVALLSEFAVMEDASPPFEFVVEIPDDFVGRSSISAMGKNDSGGFAEARAVEIIVESPAELTGVSISSSDIYLNGLNDRRELGVSGQYSDGKSRSISESNGGVSFVSSDPSILTVSESGIVVPKRNGTVTITARSGNFEDSIAATVLNADD